MNSYSLILLAVKNIRNHEGYYSIDYGITTSDISTIKSIYMSDYINFLTEEIKDIIPENLMIVKDEIFNSFDSYKDLSHWEDGGSELFCLNIIYNKKLGQMFLKILQINPLKDYSYFSCDITYYNLNFRFEDDFMVLYQSKRSWSGIKKWTEKKYIPSTISFQKLILSLTKILSPIFNNNNIIRNNNIIQSLLENTNSMTNIIPNDNINKLIYDPILKKNILINDSTILKLIPTKLEIIESQTFQ